MRASEDQLNLDGRRPRWRCCLACGVLRALVPLLRAFYRRRVGGGDTIEDLVQDTLIAVHSPRMGYNQTRPYSAWLSAVAHYKMIDHFRRTRQTCPIDDLEDILVTQGFEKEANARMDVDHWLEIWLGRTWKKCPWLVLILSAPILIGLL